MIFVSNKEQFISHPLLKENYVLRRAYQENIFINCLNSNCLVVIPTGLGKTIIALMLAIHRLSETPNSKIIFLAPTKPLVNQHYKSFLDLTVIPEENLKAITGTTSPEKRRDIWKDLKIAFMTPQVLQNDIISNLYSLKDVSLIIFDECHRSVGDYAYCFIAKKYVESSENHQILGLTASPGSTEGKINEIKNNLYIDRVEIRTEQDSDVKPYIHNVDNEWIKVKLPSEFLDVKKIITEKLRTIYKSLKQQDLLNSSDITKVTRKDLLALDKIINGRVSASRAEEEKFQLFTAKKNVANAIRLSYMDELIETQGVSALDDYMKKNIKKIKQNTANKSLKELFGDSGIKHILELIETIKQKGIFHPKLEKLVEILHNQIIENSDSRILVFCHFRDSVNNIVKFVEIDEVIRAHKFVGQVTKSSDKGLTQKEQIQLLEDFKEGIYNTLVATSVGEEGLDIAECDLVIFYDVIPSAVRSIQRRGRTGRKKEGKVFTLMAEGTRDEGYFWAEKAKERVMKQSLKSMKENDSSFKAGQSNLLNFINEEEDSKDSSNVDNASDLRFIQKIKDAQDYKIICDSRETASAVVRALSLMGVNIELKQLPVADYILSERVGIERKSAQDFNDSVKDGRLFNELFDLKNKFVRPILILEGDPFLHSSINQNALYGAITSIILNLGITIYKTGNPSDSAMFLYQLAKKEQSDSKMDVKLRFDKKPIEISSLLEYIVAGIPGINALRAKNLLGELKSLQEIFNADIGDLMKVENVGKKIAQEIYKLSRFKYQNDY
ncbi:MAG: DEAD/DEAH box helicase family protein [Candidatus Lokiarchaeota archaeon]|nr:DEAD/DEAH box helicase family protein [Candidatus Lokiarchaeota archaeon]